MSAGLVASTVTPGSTAPEASLTVPAMTACAAAVAGRSAKQTQIARDPARTRIWHLHIVVDLGDPAREWPKLLLCLEKINRSCAGNQSRDQVSVSAAR